jgi:MFS family permease
VPSRSLRLRPAARLRLAFPALAHRNYRLFLGGQFISLCGTWMQTVAHGWLVLTLTNSPLAVGLVSMLGSMPILLFTLYGGIVADRVDKHRLIVVLQCLMLLEAVALGVLVATHAVTVAWVIGLAVFFGLLTAFEVPARQAFVAEMVGKGQLMNAIALNSSAFNVARVVGPAVAGVTLAAFGPAACFFVNAASYLAVIVGLLRMRREEQPRSEVPVDLMISFREGLRYVWHNRWPRALVILTTIFTVFGYPFMTMLPVYARDVLGTGAGGYGAVVASVGAGAAAGALFLAGFGRPRRQTRVALGSAALFGLVLAASASARTFVPAVALFTLAGLTMALHGIAANTLLQREAPAHLRGRVMSFYAFAVLGLAPLGSLQVGWVSERFGVAVAFLIGGIACTLGAGLLGWHLHRTTLASRAAALAEVRRPAA